MLLTKKTTFFRDSGLVATTSPLLPSNKTGPVVCEPNLTRIPHPYSLRAALHHWLASKPIYDGTCDELCRIVLDKVTGLVNGEQGHSMHVCISTVKSLDQEQLHNRKARPNV